MVISRGATRGCKYASRPPGPAPVRGFMARQAAYGQFGSLANTPTTNTSALSTSQYIDFSMFFEHGRFVIRPNNC
jgi:hypothetical protein